MINIPQNSHATCSQLHHLGAGRRVELLKVRLMVNRDHHQMTAGVGIAVEDHKGALAAERDQVLGAVFLCLRRAKDTTIGFTAFDIFHTPR